MQTLLREGRDRRIHRAGDDHHAGNEPTGRIREEDACIFFNYRADRGREMTQVLTASPLKLHFTTMTQYDKSLDGGIRAFEGTADHILANVMAR